MQVDNIQSPRKSWRYFVPGKKGCCWGAVICIDSAGIFLAYSDHGTYGYRWTHPGEIADFREFFLRMDSELDYFRRKLAPDQVFDPDGTTTAIRRRVCELRREKRLSKDHARAEWELASCFSNEAECTAYWYERTTLNDSYDLPVYEPDPMCVAFVEHILSKLPELIRAELELERGTTTANVG